MKFPFKRGKNLDLAKLLPPRKSRHAVIGLFHFLEQPPVVWWVRTSSPKQASNHKDTTRQYDVSSEPEIGCAMVLFASRDADVTSCCVPRNRALPEHGLIQL
jgi:hypothetical protein